MLVKRTWAEINLDNLRYNYANIKKTVGDKVAVLAIVKANAYGHGAVSVSTCLEDCGCDWFGVAAITEALELRRGGITKPILITGYTPPECALTLADNSITQTLLSVEYSEQLSAAAVKAGVTVNCHVKLDTGMSRIGLECRDVAETADQIADINRLPGLSVTGIFTHFTSTDLFDAESIAFTIRQGTLFDKISTAAEQRGVHFELRHCCNSAGVVFYKQFHFDMVRPGIILYGLTSSGEPFDGFDLKPVMELKSMVAQIKHLHKGDTVGYCREFVAEGDMTVATVPIGYADGYFRNMKGKGLFYVHGELAPVVGRINMDQLELDVTGIPVVCGEEVTAYGGESPITADSVAVLAQTSSFEWLTNVSRRVPRIYFENGEQVGYEDYLE